MFEIFNFVSFVYSSCKHAIFQYKEFNISQVRLIYVFDLHIFCLFPSGLNGFAFALYTQI